MGCSGLHSDQSRHLDKSLIVNLITCFSVASYASYLLNASHQNSPSFGLAAQASPAAHSRRPDGALARGSNPKPLLADVLAGGQLSNEALLDLRVSLADNLARQ